MQYLKQAYGNEYLHRDKFYWIRHFDESEIHKQCLIACHDEENRDKHWTDKTSLIDIFLDQYPYQYPPINILSKWKTCEQIVCTYLNLNYDREDVLWALKQYHLENDDPEQDNHMIRYHIVEFISYVANYLMLHPDDE